MKRPKIFRALYLNIFFICTLATWFGGCDHVSGPKSAFEEADHLSSRGNYHASLEKYGEIIKTYPASGDRALFEMGIIDSHPENEQRDYRKALQHFQTLVKKYPESGYRQNSEMMVFYLVNVAAKDDVIRSQQARIDSLRQELACREKELVTLQKKIEALQQKVVVLAMEYGSVDKVLVHKRERRLTLVSKGQVIKTYKIALGGNPIGPKEREGDKKTPEGTYVIDSRNRDSQYHLSLHISYPSERDKKRAKELGVSPGGDIAIHGIKKGFAEVGDAHTGVDWTKGCIAVTDEEIEEIDRLVPDGTVIEILP